MNPPAPTPVLGRGAEISVCLRYRYQLWRSWDGELPATEVLFVMLNPSTADGHVDDPTIRKCVGFAQRWGHSIVRVVNLFAYRATDPKELVREERRAGDIIGPDNDWSIGKRADRADRIVVAWGQSLPRACAQRAVDVANILKLYEKPMACLGRTSSGQPRHPLMLAYDTPIEPWESPLV